MSIHKKKNKETVLVAHTRFCVRECFDYPFLNSSIKWCSLHFSFLSTNHRAADILTSAYVIEWRIKVGDKSRMRCDREARDDRRYADICCITLSFVARYALIIFARARLCVRPGLKGNAAWSILSSAYKYCRYFISQFPFKSCSRDPVSVESPSVFSVVIHSHRSQRARDDDRRWYQDLSFSLLYT